ncbi:hypothetical protein A4S06_08445 [Erysipelotrichaceae bacterium MTC7]|nr:hypothetical protein A4S06_08445 [Erysipelotrichaceae bacterium MTC7]
MNYFKELKKWNNEYYFAFTFFISAYYSLRTSLLQTYPIILFLFLSVVFVFLKIFTTSYERKEYLLIFGLIIFGFFNWYFSKSTTSLIIILAIVGIKNVSFRKTLKIRFITKIIFMISIILASFFGFVDNLEMVHLREGESVLRNALGYEHPNVLGKVLLEEFLLFLVLYKDRFENKDLLLMALINLLQFYFTKSRTSFAVICLLIVFVFIIRKTKKMQILINFGNLTYLSSLILFLISYVFPKWVYGSVGQLPLIKAIDSLLQYRITYSHIFLYRFQVSLFGQKIVNYWNNKYAFLDSGYLNLLLANGLVAVILFFVGLFKTIKYLVSKKQIYVLLSIFMIGLYAVTENILSTFFYNFTFIYFSAAIYNNVYTQEELYE